MNIEYNKQKRKFKNAWEVLCKPKNYLIAETINELKEYLLKPKLKLNKTECYLNQKAQQKLYEIIGILFSIKDLENTISFNTVLQTILEATVVEIENKISGKELREFDAFFPPVSG